jgi:hypothetical protein
MIVSPSKPHPVVVADVPKDNGLYDVVALSIFKYFPVDESRIEPEMTNLSPEASGPKTGLPSVIVSVY